MTYKIFHSDILNFKWDGEPFHASLNDSPYGLSFMGKSWDDYNPKEFQDFVTEWGRVVLSMMYPASVMLCFGGTRTYHRLVCGLEDAGWEIFDSIIAWTYGNGFPKSHNSKVHEGYGTALKPSYEPIVLCRAPRQGYTYAQCLEQFGTGSLNIDETRIPMMDNDHKQYLDKRQSFINLTGKRVNSWKNSSPRQHPNEASKKSHLGRWGTNTILVHHPNCSDELCVDSCHVHIMGVQSGQLENGFRKSRPVSDSSWFADSMIEQNSGHDDTGTASRFFYQAKAPKWERDKGITNDPVHVETMDENSSNYGRSAKESDLEHRNIHPTVKPIELTTYLATLIRPPLEQPSRLLVPFSGSGSEMIGGYFGGWSDIVGIELEPEYIDIAEQRLKWWLQFENYKEAEHNHLSKMSINQRKLL